MLLSCGPSSRGTRLIATETAEVTIRLIRNVERSCLKLWPHTLARARALAHTHTHTHKHTHPHARTHTQALSLSLSLSHSHTHTHTKQKKKKEKKKASIHRLACKPALCIQAWKIIILSRPISPLLFTSLRFFFLFRFFSPYF